MVFLNKNAERMLLVSNSPDTTIFSERVHHVDNNNYYDFSYPKSSLYQSLNDDSSDYLNLKC